MSYTVTKFDDKPSFNKQGTDRAYGIKYIVHSTTANDTDIHAASKATGMPGKGSQYEYDLGVYMDSLDLENVQYHDGGTTFVFTANYKTSTSVGVPSESEDPLDEPPKVKFSRAKYVIPFDKGYLTDVNGNITDDEDDPTDPVVTTAGTPFDPPVATQKGNLLIDMTYNVSTFKPEWIFDYSETCNIENITLCGLSIPAKHARINDINAANNYDADDNEYWTVLIQIEVSKTEIHKKEIPNRGYMCKNSSGDLDNIYRWKKQDDTTVVICKGEIDESAAAIPKEWKDIEGEGRAELAQEAALIAEDGTLLPLADPTYYVSKVSNFLKSWSTLNLPKTASLKVRGLK